MRALLAVIVLIYVVGIGVALAPTIQAKWNGATASELASGVAQALPSAATWPARAYHSITDHS